jgi:hypothetical protein
MSYLLDKLPVLVCLVLVLFTPGLSVAADDKIGDKTGETVGSAYDLKSDELLYRETHCVSADKLAREVIYEDTKGELIARKMLDYSLGATTPSFVQHNLYSSELIEVALEQGVVTMAVIDAKSNETRKSVTEQPGRKLPVVIDAGFDVFVRENWDSLVAGESYEFQFPFADRLSLIELRIRRFGCSYSTKTDQCFRLELASWLLRLVVKPIELGYDPKLRRLKRFRGLSNIGDKNGNGLVVDIKYDYQNIPGEACQLIEQTLIDKSALAITALLTR